MLLAGNAVVLMQRHSSIWWLLLAAY
jgi:hypothetical protein